MASKSSNVTFGITVRASGVVNEYRAVGFDGAQAATDGQKIQGISHTGADDGGVVLLNREGWMVWETGSAIAKGDGLVTDGDGRCIPDDDDKHFVFADSLDAASDAGEFVRALRR